MDYNLLTMAASIPLWALYASLLFYIFSIWLAYRLGQFNGDVEATNRHQARERAVAEVKRQIQERAERGW